MNRTAVALLLSMFVTKAMTMKSSDSTIGTGASISAATVRLGNQRRTAGGLHGGRQGDG